MMESKYNTQENEGDIKNIKKISELERIVNKAKKLGAEAVGTYNNHTAVRIAGRWYVPFLRKDQSSDDDPCLRPITSFSQVNSIKDNFEGNTTNRSFGNTSEFNKTDSIKENKDNPFNEKKPDDIPKGNHGFSPLKKDSDLDSNSESDDDLDDVKKGWKKPRKKLL